ncbi:MAG: peptidase S41 [Flavobacteriaceae bacterium]|nr:peptidase S41 [Flavobacteriaceae bacterium]
MKFLKGLAVLGLFLVMSCKDDAPDPTPNSSVYDKEDTDAFFFVYNAMNNYYLWNDYSEALSEGNINNTTELEDYLGLFDTPEDLFEGLVYDRENTDSWSWIVDDYIALEKYFAGVYKTNGMEFKLTTLDGNNVVGVVLTVFPDTSASLVGLKRGDVFYSIDGSDLDMSNYYALLSEDGNYELGMCDIVDNIIVPDGEVLTLTEQEYTENPIYIYKTYMLEGVKIGYLMYNGFKANYDKELNGVFAYFKSEGITELILDLRYNGGGRVSTCKYLSGMITGQLEGEVFYTKHWNDNLQAIYEERYPESLTDTFTNTMKDDDGSSSLLNNLNLERVYTIVTSGSASSSELLITSLQPYIDVVMVGSTTHGKYVASATLYDSPNFSKTGANPDHKWAIQPIIYQTKNKLGENSKGGLLPTHELKEQLSDLGVLGELSDPLLAKTISIITGVDVLSKKTTPMSFSNDVVWDSKGSRAHVYDMYE